MAPREVYYTSGRGGGRLRCAVAAAALLLAAGVGGAAAQDPPRFTLDPVKAKGPAAAPVTIFEFSDYQ